MPQLITKLTAERETKGALRFEEVDAQGLPTDMDNGILVNIYLRKKALGTARPKAIRVTIEWE